MSVPRKYDQEFRERAIRMLRERLPSPGSPSRAPPPGRLVVRREPETLRNWVEDRDRTDDGRPVARAAESEEVRALKRRVA